MNLTSPHIIHQPNGRTLLEICVTLGIFALTGALSAPKLSHIRSQLDVRKVTDGVEQLASHLPTISRQYGQSLSLRVSLGQLLLTTRTEPVQRVRVFNIIQSISLRINTQDQRILAHPSGAVSPARITISNGDLRCQLTLSLRGRVRKSCS